MIDREELKSRIRSAFADLAVALSLIIGIAAAAAWGLTSNGWGQFAALQGPNISYVITLIGGSLSIQVARVSPDPERPETSRWHFFCGNTDNFSFDPLADTSGWSRFGLVSTIQRIPYGEGMITHADGTAETETSGAVCRSAVIPLWVIALLAAILPVRWGRNTWRKRIARLRAEQGLCSHCGYDLRGSPSCCPECGTTAIGIGEGAKIET